MDRKHVVVAGAGLAGLTASVLLASNRRRVTLVEAKPFLGGRTYSYRDKKTGDLVDNGQHVLTTTYAHTFKFLELIGTRDKVHFPDTLQTFFKDRRYGDHWLRGPKLPGPLAPMAGIIGLLGVPSLTLPDRLALLRALPGLARIRFKIPERLKEITADEWFNELGLTPALRRAFFDPFTISTLNEKPWRVSAHLFAQLMNWGFVEGGSTGRLGYPTVTLDELYVRPAEAYLKERDCRIVTGDPVTDVELQSKTVAKVTLKSGTELKADAYVLALPPAGMAKLVKDTALRDDPFFAKAANIEDAPIVAVHLWYDKPLKMTNSFEGLLDSPIEWVFDRSAMTNTGTGSGRHYYTLIVSASWDLMPKKNQEILETAMEYMRDFYPESRDYKVLHASVVREPAATFSGVPGFDALRCRQRTPLKNLFLAGDWTQTGLPSTMESACRSASLAVEEAERLLTFGVP